MVVQVTRWTRPAMAAAVAMAVATPLAADETSRLGPVMSGSRVRIHAPTAIAKPLQGHVIEVTDRAIVILTGSSTLQVPRDAVTRLEVATGRRSNWKKGALAGLLLYGVMSPLIVELDRGSTREAGGDCGSGECVGYPEVIAGGALIGAVVGHFVKSDRWTPIDPQAASVGIAANRKGVGLAATVSW